MARLTDLTRTLSNFTGVPQASLAVIARVLREAGLVATGTRGPGAQMGAADVASLLLAISAQGHHLKAAEIVEEVGAQKLISVNQFYALHLNFGQCTAEDLGLHLGQDLIGTLSNVISKYSTHARRALVAESQNGSRPGRIGFSQSVEALKEDIVLPVADRTPRSIEIRLTRRSVEYFSELIVRDMDGTGVALSFSSSGDVLNRSARSVGMEVTVTVQPWVTHAAVCCIRGIDVSDNHFSIEDGSGL